MTRDLDTLLRDADPLRDRSGEDAALLRAVRERVDRERSAVGGVHVLRPRWGRRIGLVAAAAAVLTAVPIVLTTLSDDEGRPPLIQPAVAADGTIVCGVGYTEKVAPADVAPVRLLPDRLPEGWSYTTIRARSDLTSGVCVPPSLTALRLGAEGLVAGRVSITGPVDASIDEGRIVADTVADTVLGHEARRFDGALDGIEYHRWVWTDDRGDRWSAEASGMPLDEGRAALGAVSVDGTDVGWDAAAAPGWSLVHLRDGEPYGVPGRLLWMVELTDGTEPRLLDVWRNTGPAVPLQAEAGIGQRVTTVDGHPAVLAQPRGGEDAGGPPGSEPSTPVLVELSPGTIAFSFAYEDDMAQVQDMLASLRPVEPADPRVETYGE